MSLVSGVMTAADFMSPPQLIAHAQRLEALGYDSMWITDIFGRDQRVWARSGFTEADWSGTGSDRLVDTYMNWGDLDTVRARMQAFLDAGVSDVILAGGQDLIEALAPGQ